MSTDNKLTFDQALVKIADLEKSHTELQTLIASKKATNENDDKLNASFKQAMEDLNKKDKEHSAMEDDKEKVKDAFKKAQDESDPEKKKEAMKKAIEEKEDYEQKHSKKAEDTPKENVDKTKEKEAKIAEIVMKKVPLMNTILEATKIMDASNYDKVEKELTASTLEEVQQRYDTIQPYLAVIGAGSKTTVPSGQIGMIPFQANAATQTNSTDIFEASVDTIDFSKVKTSDIMEMYK